MNAMSSMRKSHNILAMKPVIILVFAMARVLFASQIPDTIKDTWVVTGYRFGGTSALSEKEAKAWIGKTLVVDKICISLDGGTNSSPRVEHKVHDSQTYFWGGFRIKPSEVGFTAKQVHEYEILHQDGTPWIAPGSCLLLLPNAEALASWDGVFFVLKRKLPKK